MSVYVHKGPAALREGRYWRGWKSGNIPARSVERPTSGL
jgi:hypothetical protein